MAGTKIIKKRIASVRSTCKITRTMEMVSTAKSKKLVNRLQTAALYRDKLSQITASLQREAKGIGSPFLRAEKKPQKSALIVVSANRGLCGGYNTNLLRLSHNHYEKYRAKNIDCSLYVLGKKGSAFYKFLKIPVKKNYTHIDDNLTRPEAEDMALSFMQKFKKRTYSQIEIASTVYHSAGKQKPAILPFLPVPPAFLSQKKPADGNGQEQAQSLMLGSIFEPSPQEILYEIIPIMLKTKFYTVLLEALASEQIARRIAMKNATDAGEEMLKALTHSYHRARQASITQELAEIVAGADAV